MDSQIKHAPRTGRLAGLSRLPWLLAAGLAACTVAGPVDDDDGLASPSTATTGSGGGSVTATSGTGAEGGAGQSSTASTGGSSTAPSCYGEAFAPAASLADLEAAYDSSAWLPTMIEVLDRRFESGFVLMDAMKDDPWLDNMPQYFDMSSWDGMIEAIDTACHEELHGYDFEQALGHSGQHLYYQRHDLEIIVPELSFFARSEILPVITQGGSVTSNYDSTYLTSGQSHYDLIFLADELNAYIMGLACATSVADQIRGGHSYRDGVAAHVYYLLAYLQVARTNHPALYAEWKSDPDWQHFVRLAWARARFWTDASAPYPALGIHDAAIWARIDDPAMLAELELFTGDAPADVACSP